MSLEGVGVKVGDLVQFLLPGPSWSSVARGLPLTDLPGPSRSTLEPETEVDSGDPLSGRGF